MKKYLKWFFILVPFFALIIFFIIVALIPNKAANEEKIKVKEYVTKDGRVTFVAPETFKQEEKSDYDLYLNKNNNQIVGVFSYNLNEYEENTAKQVLDKQVQYFLDNKKDMKLFKKETILDLEDKKITRVEYSGKTDKSSECVYIISVIEFKTDANYVLFVNEVIFKNKYENNISEMINILKNVKLN